MSHEALDRFKHEVMEGVMATLKIEHESPHVRLSRDISLTCRDLQQLRPVIILMRPTPDKIRCARLSRMSLVYTQTLDRKYRRDIYLNGLYDFPLVLFSLIQFNVNM